MPNKYIRNYRRYDNLCSSKSSTERAMYSREHPEVNAEDKKYVFVHDGKIKLQDELKRVCERYLHTWSTPNRCTVDKIGEEDAGDSCTINYGFLRYPQVTVSFIYLNEYKIGRITIFTFKKVEDTKNFDFEELIDNFLEEHTEYQHFYQSKVTPRPMEFL